MIRGPSREGERTKILDALQTMHPKRLTAGELVDLLSAEIPAKRIHSNLQVLRDGRRVLWEQTGHEGGFAYGMRLKKSHHKQRRVAVAKSNGSGVKVQLRVQLPNSQILALSFHEANELYTALHQSLGK